MIGGRTRLWLFAVSTALVLSLQPAPAEHVFAIEGNYLRNQACEGDGSNNQPLLVKITPDQIFYVGGVCSIDERKQEGNVITMRVTCKFKSGSVLSSYINFTKKDDNTLDMAQLDGSYRAVLRRCPK